MKHKGDRTRSTSLVAPNTSPNPRSHRSRHTPAPARSRCLKHRRDHIPAPISSHPSTGKIVPIVAVGSSSAPPSRSSPPKLDPPKTELVLDTPILFSLLLNVADLAATNHQPTPLHPQTHPI